MPRGVTGTFEAAGDPSGNQDFAVRDHRPCPGHGLRVAKCSDDWRVIGMTRYGTGQGLMCVFQDFILIPEGCRRNPKTRRG
jgi:hypothetical protein